MSTSQIVLRATQVQLADYWQLTKPKVVALIVFTAVAGMAFAVATTGESTSSTTLLASTLGIALAAAGAATANCLLESRIDALMGRTRNRATAAGRLPVAGTIIFASILLAAGLGLLYAYTNLLATLLTLATFVGYAFVYTLLLKSASPQNIVVGGAAGAMPPVLGWVAVTGGISHQPLLLFLLIFVWTPPHFWALSLYRLEDYRRSGLPMLPVTHGRDFTRLHILLYSITLFAVSLLPTAAGAATWVYATGAGACGLLFVGLAYRLWQSDSDADARKLFNYSGIYLLLVFALLASDNLLFLGKLPI